MSTAVSPSAPMATAWSGSSGGATELDQTATWPSRQVTVAPRRSRRRHGTVPRRHHHGRADLDLVSPVGGRRRGAMPQLPASRPGDEHGPVTGMTDLLVDPGPTWRDAGSTAPSRSTRVTGSAVPERPSFTAPSSPAPLAAPRALTRSAASAAHLRGYDGPPAVRWIRGVMSVASTRAERRRSAPDQTLARLAEVDGPCCPCAPWRPRTGSAGRPGRRVRRP